MSEMNRVIDRINSSCDIKNLSDTELNELAQEMRKEIIHTVSCTGGHLASNLGVVELSIAIHSVFESPKDKILWDVSHQSYPHKLLTGRLSKFHTLRQEGGLSGFVRPDESEHDPFGAGHASTSISAALGLAKARDLSGGNEAIVAVIGDGALTGGLALEGMNNVRDLNTDLVVVLNDNTMSISENVTSVAIHLTKLRMAPIYQSLEHRARTRLERSSIGRRLADAADGLSHGVTRMVGGKMGTLFEELGFRYMGPIDGHNLDQLREVLEIAKRNSGPVLVHAVTIKGKGYEPAETNARRYHGISGFTVQDGKVEPSTGNDTFTNAFGETLVELANDNTKIIAITAAMPDGTGLVNFSEQFPERFFDVGIAEEHAVTFAAGLAAGGMRPVVAIYSTFLQRAYDQIVHDVCTQNLPVVFCLDRAGIVGEDGPTHQGAYDLTYLRHIPRMTLMAPRDTNQLRDMLATGLAHDGPSAIRYPRGGGPTPYDGKEPEILAIGKAEVLAEGADLTLIAIGPPVYSALAARDELKKEGIDAGVIDARFAKPLDEKTIIGAAQRSGKMIVLEENAVAGGFGGAVLELLASRGIQMPVRLMGIPDRFLEHASAESIKTAIGLSVPSIVDTAKELVKPKVSKERSELHQTEQPITFS